jgi:hypothetical protein
MVLAESTIIYNVIKLVFVQVFIIPSPETFALYAGLYYYLYSVDIPEPGTPMLKAWLRTMTYLNPSDALPLFLVSKDLKQVTGYLFKIGGGIYRARRIAALRTAALQTHLSRWAQHPCLTQSVAPLNSQAVSALTAVSHSAAIQKNGTVSARTLEACILAELIPALKRETNMLGQRIASIGGNTEVQSEIQQLISSFSVVHHLAIESETAGTEGKRERIWRMLFIVNGNVFEFEQHTVSGLQV